MLEWIGHLGSQGPYWCSLEPYRRLELLILPGTTGTQETCRAAEASRFSGGDESLGSQDPTGSLLPQELLRVSGASWQQDDLWAWCYDYH